MEVFLTETPRAELEEANRFLELSLQFERAARRIIRAAKFNVPRRATDGQDLLIRLVLCSTSWHPHRSSPAVLWFPS